MKVIRIFAVLFICVLLSGCLLKENPLNEDETIDLWEGSSYTIKSFNYTDNIVNIRLTFQGIEDIENILVYLDTMNLEGNENVQVLGDKEERENGYLYTFEIPRTDMERFDLIIEYNEKRIWRSLIVNQFEYGKYVYE